MTPLRRYPLSAVNRISPPDMEPDETPEDNRTREEREQDELNAGADGYENTITETVNYRCP